MANYDSTYITEHASHFDFESTPRNNKMIGNTMQNRTMFWGENHGNVWQSNTTSLNMWSTPVRKKVKQTANTKNNNRVEGWSIGCTETIWRGIFGQIDRKNLLIQKFTIVTSWLRSHALQVASGEDTNAPSIPMLWYTSWWFQHPFEENSQIGSFPWKLTIFETTTEYISLLYLDRILCGRYRQIDPILVNHLEFYIKILKGV